MQRIFNFDEWAQCSPEFMPTLGTDESGSRVIRLEVNAEDKCKIFVQTNDGQEHFLALVEGRDEIYFSAEGKVHLLFSGFCNIRTAEQQDWTMEPVDDTTFTTIVERRTRNPELELMMRIQQENIERRMAAQAAEYDRRLQAAIAARDVLAGVASPVNDADTFASGAGVAGSSPSSGSAETADVAGAPAPSPAPAPAAAGS